MDTGLEGYSQWVGGMPTIYVGYSMGRPPRQAMGLGAGMPGAAVSVCGSKLSQEVLGAKKKPIAYFESTPRRVSMRPFQ